MYNQIQEKADNLEPDISAKFLSYQLSFMSKANKNNPLCNCRRVGES